MKRKLDDDSESEGLEIHELPVRKRGRRLMLGDEIEQRTQTLVRKIRENGGIVNSTIVKSVALGVVEAEDKTLLEENGGHVNISRDLAYRIQKRMNLAKRRGSTSAKITVNDFEEKKEKFISQVKTLINTHNIPEDLIINFDHTGINILPISNWTMEVKGTKKVKIVGMDDKRQITGKCLFKDV